MQYRITLSLIVLTCFALVIAGCAGTQNTPAAPAAPAAGSGTGSSGIPSSAGNLVAFCSMIALKTNPAVHIELRGSND